MRRFIGGLAIGLVAVSLAACSTTGGSSAPSPSVASAGGAGGTLTGTSWVLKTYDVSGTPTAVPSGTKVDAHFSASTVNGFAGCNVYNGPATVTGATIKIGPLVSTQMACVGPGGDVEQAYLAALAKAASFTATTDALTFFDAGAKAILVYGAGPANPLEGAWTVTGFNNGNQAVTSPIVGTDLTADFAADQVAGSSGCNDYSGPYTLTGTTLKIGPLATTRKACDQKVMDQETQFLAALQASTTFTQSGAIITLTNGTENQVVLTAK